MFIKSMITKVLLNLLFSIIKIFPLRIRYAIGESIGFIISLLPTKERKIARLQMERFIGPHNVSQNLRDMYRGFGATFIESLSIQELMSKDDGVVCDTPEVLEEIKNDPNGKIFLTAHFSNWELLAAWVIKSVGMPMAVIGRELDNPTLQEALVSLRTSYGAIPLAKDNKQSSLKIVKTLKNKGIIGALIDQDTNVESIMVPFFGVNAKTPSALIDLTKRCKGSIYTFFIIRVDRAKFVVKIKKFNSHSGTFHILSEYNSALEELIRKYPSQWVWVHKRWRTKEDGAVLRSSEYMEYISHV